MIKPNKEQLHELYIVKKMTKKQIAQELNISSTSVLIYMKVFDIPRRLVSEYLLGRPKSDSHKLKLSESKKGPKHPNYGKKCKIHGRRSWYVCKNNQIISMRSSWEHAYAEYLDKNNILWEYEPKTFLLEGQAYTPDFYLTESKEWIEVKGWLTEDNIKKLNNWIKYYPDKKLILADKKYLTNLGIDLKQKWITSKPKIKCIYCNEEFHVKEKSQKLCSILCRNKYLAIIAHESKNIDKIDKKNGKLKRTYNGNQSGQNNNSAKLTSQDVLDIKKMRENKVPVRDIAKFKNISKTNVYYICKNTNWEDSYE